MKLAYQISTPEVRPAPGVTAYQADPAVSFRRLREVGYDGAELMVADPARVDAQLMARLARENRLDIPMVCTGEVFGQDKLSFSDPDDARRDEAIRRVKAAARLAAELGAQINIGRVRGGYVPGAPSKTSRRRSLDALAEVSDYAATLGVVVALEPVNTLALNFVNSTHEGISLAREIHRPNFRLMLDTAHMFIEDRDVEQSLRDSRDLLSYVHLVDSNRKYPGNCKFDFAGFLRVLREIGYGGYVSVEVFQVPDQETALEKSYAHIKPLLA